MENIQNVTPVQVNEESNLNEYALNKVQNFIDKIADKLAQKAGRDIIKEYHSENEDADICRVTVLCYFTDDITKVVRQLEEKKKWKILESKNYIDAPKKNGYRGYMLKIGIPVENRKNETAVIMVQIHTIGMEYWLEMESQITEGKVKKKDKLKSYSEHIIQMEEELLKLRKK